MKLKGIVVAALTGATSLALAAAAPAPADPVAAGQIVIGRAASGPQGDSWTSIAQLPDFWTGVWDPDWSKLFGPGAGPPPDLKPAYAAKAKAYVAAQAKGENLQSDTANCVPPGLPMSMSQPYPIEFLPTPGKITIALEAYSQMRRIHTDVKTQPANPDPSFEGHSVGHWENGDLLVDTVALKHTEIEPGVNASPQARIEERMHLANPNQLEITTTIIDPTVLNKPYVKMVPYIRKPNWDIKEYICEENDRDATDAEGRPSMNLKLKP